MSDQTNEVVRDTIVLITGVVLVTSTIWLPVDGDTGVSGAILILGMLSAGTALWAMSSASRSSHWAHLVLGVALALSPLILAFPSDLLVTDMFAVVGGVLIALLGVLGVVSSTRRAPETSRVIASSLPQQAARDRVRS